MHRFLSLLCGALALTCVLAPISASADPHSDDKAQADEFFETKVRPLLFNHCYECHSDKNQSAGLRLDSLEATLKGGGRGPALLPGDAEKSLIVRAVNYDGALKMPPSGKLKLEEIAALTAWVKMGAPWPATKGSAHPIASGDYVITPEQRKFWSFQPVVRPPLPPVKNITWCKNPIDRFILAKLEAKRLKPAPAADRRTLLRRVTYDLIGLPPTPQEVDAFVRDRSSDAWSRVVDRLLADPHYGERWGRHWLDVARYADTKGYVFNEDAVYHHAYAYRDYVIRAFNEDLPYNQFILQQLAADLLPQNDDPRPLAALGYLTVGRRFLNDPVLINDDRIDVTCRGMMGLTVGCARCHNHKFDPIPTKDYYSLYGVFASANETEVPIVPHAVAAPYQEAMARIGDLESRRADLIRAQVELLRQKGMKGEAQSAEVKATLQEFGVGADPSNEQLQKLLPAFDADARSKVQTLKSDLDALNKSKPAAPELAMALQDSPTPYEPHVFIRGNGGNPGAAVPRRFPQILSPPDSKPFAHGSGRLELAQDIASPDNPLTARVLVNRVWLYHFGAGIVRTPSDFGIRGERPTHPELLDWMASTFVRNNWSIKKLHRLMLLSATYQQSDLPDPHAAAVDPENRLLWRQNRQRLDLESLRDSLLYVAGRLDTKQGGPAMELTTEPFTTRRTVYGFIDRQNLQALYRTFDFASPDSSSAQRFRTTVPQQTLFLMNSPFVIEQAKYLAHLPALRSVSGNGARIRLVYHRLFGRDPTDHEILLAQSYLTQKETAADDLPLWQYGYGSYDVNKEPAVHFTPLSYSSGSAWQGGPKLPDTDLHYAMLTADGGHPGSDPQHAVIRRWTAPCDAAVTIKGTLDHPGQQGDGVEGRVVSSREGELGHWTAFHTRIETPVLRATVKKGDNLDFIVDCRSNDGFDSFAWAPVIRTLPPAGTTQVALKSEQEWSATSDFDAPEGPRQLSLSLWERYIQALLMTNEFNFVD